MRAYFFLYFGLILHCENSLQVAYDTSTLQQAHVMWRHGDRTADTYCLPCFQNSSQNYWPTGMGGLTMLGKNQEYDIGVALRKRYNSWLGDIYYPDVLDAISTDYPRTKMSLILVLAALYPPAVEQTWNWDLNWQPIPYSYRPATDMLLGYPLYCPNYMKVYTATLNTSEVQKMIKPTQRLTDYVNKNSNITVSSRPVENTAAIHFCLIAMEALNETLPAWSKYVYPLPMERVASMDYVLKTYNDVLIQFTGGQLLKKIIDDSQAKIKGTLVPAGRKIFLYSGHEYNVAYLLCALKSFFLHIPPYGSYVIIELHKIGQIYGFLIFYQFNQAVDPTPIIISGCNQFCPIEDFIRLLANSIPGPQIKC